jgi:ribonuclease P protein component
MIADVYSLKGPEDYEKIKNDGVLYQSKNFGASVLRRNDQGYPRFGFIVSNKISKLSTQRNRIRRAFRDALRHNLNRIKNGYDVVFLARATLEKMPVDQIMREVEDFVRKSEFYQRVQENSNVPHQCTLVCYFL